MRRVLRLEKKLAVPDEGRLFCSANLDKADEVRIEGVRLRTVVDCTGKLAVVSAGDTKRGKGAKEDVKQTKLPFPAPKDTSPVDVKLPLTGKSIWRGRDGDEVSVEILALQHYESQGYKGSVHYKPNNHLLTLVSDFTAKGE